MIHKIEQTKIGNIKLTFKKRNTETIFLYEMLFSYQNTNFSVKVESLGNYKKDLNKCINMYLKSKQEEEEAKEVQQYKRKFINEYSTLNIENLRKLREQAKIYALEYNLPNSTQYFYTAMYQATDCLIRSKAS
jgi:hypothetical protein